MAQDGIASGQQLDERATQQFRQADTDRDGAVNLKEFVAYCHSNSASRARLELRSSLGPSSESEPLACISQMQTLSQKHVQIMWQSAQCTCNRYCLLTASTLSAARQDLVWTGQRLLASLISFLPPKPTPWSLGRR